MKRVFILMLFTLPVVVSAEDIPQRKPGLWEIAVSHGSAQGAKMVMKQCTDESIDAKLQKFATGDGMGGDKTCKNVDLKRDGKNYVSSAECDVDGTKMKSRMVISGDFEKDYRAEGEIKYDPPMMGMSTMNISITGKWLGACEQGQKPGDIIMPGGMKINIFDMEKFQNM